MTSPLKGRVILITGAARGIGAAVARLAAARGARIALVGLEPDLLAELAAELRSSTGTDHVWYECDVTDQAGLDRAVSQTITELGRIDAVVANAGVANIGTVAISPADALVRTIDINVSGVIRTISATLPELIARRGYVMIISSLAAFTAMPGMAAYCASKAAVEQYGNVLRMEVAHRGVRVGTVHPGWIGTDLVKDTQNDLPSFQEGLRKLPPPLNTVLPLEKCAAAIVDGIERRRRRVFIPGTLALIESIRSLVLGPIGSAPIIRGAATTVPQMEAEVTKTGRFFGRNSAAGNR